MKIIAPNYYKAFKCIADKCKHSCCIGWEIDIDDISLQKYKSIDSDFGTKLKNNIVEAEECSYFKLTKNERCPFLNNKNLCDIIINLDESYLCQICNDHPRFRSFYNGFTEIGLGLCCEAAADLILNQQTPFTLNVIEDDGNNENCTDEEMLFFDFRNKLFSIFQDRNKSLEERINAFFEEFNTIEFNLKNKAEFFANLEILDSNWRTLIEDLDLKTDILLPQQFDLIAEKILIYFTYRHLSDALDDGLYVERAHFIVLSYRIIEILCKAHIKRCGNITNEEICNIARMYSSEIEYSQENIDAILNLY